MAGSSAPIPYASPIPRRKATAPNNARYLRIELHGTRVSGSTINVHWDNVTIEVDEGTKAFLNFRAYQVSAQVGRGFPSAVKTIEV